jgi:DNA-binding Lrp family transcriptional regulator
MTTITKKSPKLPPMDAINRGILTTLQTNGRITNAELADNAGITPPPCLRRLKALEDSGIIKGYQAVIDNRKLGWDVTFFVVVELESQKEHILIEFEEMVTSWPEVREVHMIKAGGDFLLKIVARNSDHESQIIQRLRSSPNINKIQNLSIIQTNHHLLGVPLEGSKKL